MEGKDNETNENKNERSYGGLDFYDFAGRHIL